MKEMNNVPFPKEKKNKVDYMWRDIERRAKNYGFFAKTPVPYPLTEFDLANKIAILGLKNNWGVDYVQLTYKRWFQEGKEPAVEPNLSEICRKLSLDKEKIVEFDIEILDIEESIPFVVDKEFIEKNNLKNETELKTNLEKSLKIMIGPNSIKNMFM